MRNESTIREKLGLTQHELSQYLGISRSQLVMYEKRQRELPTAALLKLSEIELFLTQHNAKKNNAALPHEKQQHEKVQQILVAFEKEYEYQQIYAERKLEKIQKAYEQKTNLLHFSDHIAANKNLSPNEKMWQQIVQTEARKNIEQNGLHKQLKWELEIKSAIMMREWIHSLKK